MFSLQLWIVEKIQSASGVRVHARVGASAVSDDVLPLRVLFLPLCIFRCNSDIHCNSDVILNYSMKSSVVFVQCM